MVIAARLEECAQKSELQKEVPIQFNVPADRKHKLMLYVKQKGYRNMTNFFNLVIIQVLDNETQMHDPKTIRPLDQALKDLNDLLPIFKKYGYRYQQVDEVNNL